MIDLDKFAMVEPDDDWLTRMPDIECGLTQKIFLCRTCKLGGTWQALAPIQWKCCGEFMTPIAVGESHDC